MSALAQKAGSKLFAKHVQQYAPVDPLYETYTDKKGRQKRRKVGSASDIRLALTTHLFLRETSLLVYRLTMQLFSELSISVPTISTRD